MKKNSMNFRAGIKTIGMMLPVLVQPVFSADRDAALNCVDIASGEERLACFDAAYAVTPAAGKTSKEVAVIAPTAATADPLQQREVDVVTEENFGLPQEPLPEGTMKNAITRTERGPTGRLTFYLENGQVWKQIESTPSPFRVTQDPAVAVIKSSAFGSFKLSVEGGSRSVRVKRIK